VLRFYGYDLDGATNMLTEPKMNETLDATESPSMGNDTTTLTTNEADEETTTTVPETSVSPTETTGDTEEESTNTSSDDENEDVTTVAPGRKRRGRLERGLKAKRGQNHYQFRREKLKHPHLHHQNLELLKIQPNRRSRSYYVLLDEEYENEFHQHHHFASTFPTITPDPTPATGVFSTTTETSLDHSVSSARPIIGKYRNTNKELFENLKSDSIEHIFYLNEHDSVRVPFKIYDSVMKFAHVPSLEASILEIDLDTEYYNLMIIVPDHFDGLKDLTNRLRLHEPSTLRKLRNSMEYCWVKTIVPKFSLKGNTILTNDLQNVRILVALFLMIHEENV
jgi:hypothetical protein